MTRVPAALITVAALVVCGVGVTTSPASAASSSDSLAAPVAQVGLHGIGDLVVDDAHQQLFITGAADEGRLAVVDLRTGESTRLPYLAGATALDLDDSSDAVWVALGAEGAVARVSTSAPFPVTSFPVPGCATDVAEAAGRVYVAHAPRCVDGATYTLSALDPGTGNVHTIIDDTFASYTRNAALTQVPGTSRLVMQSRGSSPGEAALLDGAREQVLATRRGDEIHSPLPDGTGLLTWSGQVVSSTDFSPLRSVPAPGAVGTISEDGLLAVPDSATTAVRELDTGQAVGRWVGQVGFAHQYPTRVAWSSDTLLLVSGSAPVSVRRVVPRDPGPSSMLTLAAPGPDSRLSPGQEVEVSGRLVDHAGTPLGGRTVRVHTTEAESVAATTGADGSWSTRVTLTYGRIVAVYDGEPGMLGSRVSESGTSFPQPALTLEPPAPAAPGDQILYTGRVVDGQGIGLPDQSVQMKLGCVTGWATTTLRTAPDGTFTYRSPAPRCPEQWYTFDVGGGLPEAEGSTPISWALSELVVDGPGRLAPGQPATLTARLTIDGRPAPGRVIGIRSPASGVVGSRLVTDADGVVRFETDAEGPYSYEFAFAGDDATLGSRAISDPWVVAKYASTLTASASPSAPVAGRPLTFSGRLSFEDGASPAGAVVRVLEDRQVIGTGAVAGDGSFTVTTLPWAGPRTYDLVFAGNEQRAGTRVSIPLDVSPQPAALSTQLAPRASQPEGRRVLLTTVEPARADVCLKYQLDRRTPSGWRRLSSSTCRRTDADGLAAFRTPDLGSSHAYRVRPVLVPDRMMARTLGAWTRFRLG